MDKIKAFETQLVNLADLGKFSFVIPSYQRPYVWGKIEVDKLLGDLLKSFEADGESNYYVGTILTKEDTHDAELIDGQQRFTTLWLTAFVFWTKDSNSELEKILRRPDGKLKMSFEIRTEVANYLNDLINQKEYVKENIENTTSHPYLKNIAVALANIAGFVDEKVEPGILKDFGDFIYRHVYFIKNVTPEKLNLNKLFSTINSAGVQLEQTDIVKAKLLHLIDEKVLYGKIWEACENMNNFFERNVRTSFSQSNLKEIDLESYAEFDPNKFSYKQDSGEDQIVEAFSMDSVSLEKIGQYKTDKRPLYDESRESEEIYCRSIINFGQLLLHAYRIHLKLECKPDFEGTFHVNRLIDIFSNLKEPEEIKRFFQRLWRVRFLFDRYVIKWISDTNTKNDFLELVNINRNPEGYYSRSPFEKTNTLMLQSVLYFTGDYHRQFWLTPFLYFLLNEHQFRSANDEGILRELEKMDNALSICDTLNDKDATFTMLDAKLKRELDIEGYLRENAGTSFKHYWFQKLEYLLWKNWKGDRTEEFKNYRIVSRNSIEHISPQKDSKLDAADLHSFGNLVLLSVSQNSEYGAKPFTVKQSMFKEKRSTYDTLKSFHIFKGDRPWDKNTINGHMEEMIKVMIDHYNLDDYAK